MPSKILSRMPGPNVTHIGAPVPNTGSPIPRPTVSSYTCTVASLPDSEITSPIRRSLPT